MSVDAFQVPLGRHVMSGLVHHARWLWRGLGNLETSLVRAQVEQTPIVKPIFVSGLARSGTSVLIEILASHPSVATHQYRDFPFLFIPYWWRQTLDRSAPANVEATERAHGDRLMVTPSSPDAFEEVLWMAFFKHLHDPRQRNALDAMTLNPKFETFYRDHIRKLLLISNKTRYAAKGNYNLTRMEYLLKLFPDARFVLPVRRPRDQIASLVKQHKLFVEAAAKYPRSVKHLDRVGHFEFGKHLTWINPNGRAEVIESIDSLWKSGEEVRAWARYWANLYRWIAERLKSDDALRAATLVVRYEEMCDQPEQMLRTLLDHVDLPDDSGELLARWTPSLSRPTYYKPVFSEAEERAIDEETREVVRALGYG
jgi:hypothetical protein